MDKHDLYIGAEINIFGKPVILKQCSAATAQWNIRKGRRLIQIRNKLIEEIPKYDSKPLISRLLIPYETSTPGGYNLKGIMVQISELKAKLGLHRPKLASKIAPHEIFND